MNDITRCGEVKATSYGDIVTRAFTFYVLLFSVIRTKSINKMFNLFCYLYCIVVKNHIFMILAYSYAPLHGTGLF